MARKTIKIRDMFNADFNEQYGDVDICNDVTDEYACAFCGLELTEKGKERFADILDVEIEVGDRAVTCKIDEFGGSWSIVWESICELFSAAAGYVSEDEYNEWFVELD